MTKSKYNPIRKGMSSKIYLLAYSGELNIYRITQILIAGWSKYPNVKNDVRNISKLIFKHELLFDVNEKKGKKCPQSKIEPLIIEIKNEYELTDISIKELSDLFNCKDFRSYIESIIKKYPIHKIEKDAFLEIMFAASFLSETANGIKKLSENIVINIPNYDELKKNFKKLPKHMQDQIINEILDRTIDKNPKLINKNKKEIREEVKNKLLKSYLTVDQFDINKDEIINNLTRRISKYNEDTIQVLLYYYEKISTMIKYERSDKL